MFANYSIRAPPQNEVNKIAAVPEPGSIALLISELLGLLDTRRRFLAGFLWLASTLLVRDDPVISEFMATNATTLKDGHENYKDWLELYIPDATAWHLAGWGGTPIRSTLAIPLTVRKPKGTARHRARPPTTLLPPMKQPHAP